MEISVQVSNKLKSFALKQAAKVGIKHFDILRSERTVKGFQCVYFRTVADKELFLLLTKVDSRRLTMFIRNALKIINDPYMNISLKFGNCKHVVFGNFPVGKVKVINNEVCIKISDYFLNKTIAQVTYFEL